MVKNFGSSFCILLSIAIASWISDANGKPEEIPQFRHGVGLEIYSFNSPYLQDTSDPIRFWRFTGQAAVGSNEKTGKDVVKLTSAEPSQRGIIYNKVPFMGEEFEVYFDFAISTKSRDPGADGFTFFALSSQPAEGPVYGLTDNFKGIVLAFDTYSNSRRQRVPYVYPILGRGQIAWNAMHDGADVQLTQGCYINPKYDSRISLRYAGKSLFVSVGDKKHKNLRACFLAKNVEFPFDNYKEIHFGFSAETGHYFEEHAIKRFQARAVDKYPDIDGEELLYEVEEGQDLRNAFLDLYHRDLDELQHEDNYDEYDFHDLENEHHKHGDDHNMDPHDDHHDHEDDWHEDDPDHDHYDGSKASTRYSNSKYDSNKTKPPKGLTGIERDLEELKTNMLQMMRDQAPDQEAFMTAVRNIKADLGMLLEGIDDMDMTFGDIEEGASDLPQKASTLLQNVRKLQDVIDQVEMDLNHVETSCRDVDSVLDDLLRLIVSITDDMINALNGSGVAFWSFAMACQVLFALIFNFIRQQEKLKGAQKGGRSTFGRLV
mmetsp:Transcript_3213/g.9803  ORF Transcript_3213/g.9803 Transcript_3213/m.9803 type:complete len:544 (-) Transcript_3213:77-1708(-)|eukprot:CAMPEP_0198725408 /NCGR_PEP_ID=MMETSP1475-20131203/2721_1 /TAXON_ID= ORGANISM="Unidentified sp., Strain CCMP1999" /NCGR_SAMPLE_ID=MMETSP1475 /ASSEMBLY_ACC=CAM_ASM_001111 /LENGTH=543 /DNA_ID=CAMNT_0044487179 /DNA_START=256 /DNA_END=1887 /DNA_ORIENTATION=-